MWKNKHLKAIPKADVDKDGKVVVELERNDLVC